jgi:HSP20 family protein
MMTLVKFSPEKKNSALLPGFNDIFESVLGDTFFSDRRVNSLPAVNISECKEAYYLELAAPGLKKEDFKIELKGDLLSISTAHQSEQDAEGRTYNRKEYSYSAFQRTFTIPDGADADKIQAAYTDGVLRLELPKKEEQKTVSRQIGIQ